jgi:hypothetical protein
VVEHLPFKQVADGSIPSTLTKFLVVKMLRIGQQANGSLAFCLVAKKEHLSDV